MKVAGILLSMMRECTSQRRAVKFALRFLFQNFDNLTQGYHL